MGWKRYPERGRTLFETAHNKRKHKALKVLGEFPKADRTPVPCLEVRMKLYLAGTTKSERNNG